jgi:fumarylacetoacetate (FAA) hydrolase family protein
MMDLADSLPFDDAILVSRVWMPGDIPGPSVISLVGRDVYDMTSVFPTMSDLLEQDDAAELARQTGSCKRVCSVTELLRNSVESQRDPCKPYLLSPIDLQAIKASGVTFMVSLIERVIEEKAAGDLRQAAALRESLTDTIGESLLNIKPGSSQAEALKRALIDKGIWSQYLEVAIGPDAEVFTKAQVLSSVGQGASIGVHPNSQWNNPEPEIVLAVNSRGNIMGATLGNDVNLRDFEGRSALLLGSAKDNNASCAIGPFIRLFDGSFNLDTIRSCVVSLDIQGEDGFSLSGTSHMAEISRSPEELVAHSRNEHHYFPDGFVLFLGTMFVPTKDRDRPGMGFTHKVGDVVTISTPSLGRLMNRVDHTHKIAPWTFGVRSLFRNLTARGLADRVHAVGRDEPV